MGYWQNGLEIEKKSMLPYGNAALIRVKLESDHQSMRTIELNKVSLLSFNNERSMKVST